MTVQAMPLQLRVRAIETLAPRLKRLSLASADGAVLPPPPPGSHLTLALPLDGGRTRSYSIVSPSGERDAYSLIVRHAERSRGGSAYIHHQLTVGDLVESAAPTSQFSLHSLARKHLLIGGGIGVTPLLSFLHDLRTHGRAFELHQICRADEADAFRRLLSPFAGLDIHLHTGRAGLDLRAIIARQPLGAHLYCCGPEPLMAAVQATAADVGWPAGALHQESFGATGGAPFTVRLARSGRDIAVGADETLLEALEAAGANPPALCRGGACGECITVVVDGAPDHRDHFLSEDERASGRLIMPCVSRAKSDLLTLDL
jgi:ferredoxin-NADP reductase